jgi:hypothetical protein
MIMKKFTAVCMVVGLLSAGVGNAAVTLTFDELPTQPVNGLSYKGVTFGFTIGGSPSTDAQYGAVGPGDIMFLQDKTLEGNAAGVLTLDFAQPTDTLQFGIALNSFDPVVPAYSVQLFDASSAPLATLSANTYPLVVWSEDLFSYSGTPISRAVIGFNNQAATRFAMDNLTHNSVGDIDPVPAPGAILLCSIGVGLVSWLKRRRTL